MRHEKRRIEVSQIRNQGVRRAELSQEKDKSRRE